jgi:hypothetical protein
MSKYIKINEKILLAIKFPNKMKIDNNDSEYVSKLDKNKVFRWYKIKNMNQCKSPEKYYMQFPENYLQKKFIKYNNKSIEKKLNSIKKILKKENIYLLKIKWKNNYNYSDNAFYNAEEKSKSNNFIFYTEHSFFWSQNTGKLIFQWNLDRKSKKIVFDLLKKKFNKKFIMPKSLSNAIIIKL